MKSVEPIRQKKKIDAMKAIFLASGKYGQRNLVLFSIGINMAYRISDLRQLKLSDVLEISRGRVIVKERLAMKEQKGKHNSVFISNKLRKVILDYVQSEFPEQLQAQDFSKYLFPSRKGADTPLTRQSLWRIIHEAGTAVGLKEIGPHSMRKTFGFFLYKQGTKTEIIQSLLNHSSQRETLRYIGITQEDKDTAVKSLDL
jgi:integrase